LTTIFSIKPSTESTEGLNGGVN